MCDVFYARGNLISACGNQGLISGASQLNLRLAWSFSSFCERETGGICLFKFSLWYQPDKQPKMWHLHVEALIVM
jgi:hypothetical protein